ncbi:hypothetical protein AMECASPLE_015918 [Ameca splendens]|uniref:Uncharacterized protein n=1 Tax=Ameca splendens TaxID=208324 RepID=A0ABV0Y296_9TELE
MAGMAQWIPNMRNCSLEIQSCQSEQRSPPVYEPYSDLVPVVPVCCHPQSSHCRGVRLSAGLLPSKKQQQ